jgi:hypothetical protein
MRFVAAISCAGLLITTGCGGPAQGGIQSRVRRTPTSSPVVSAAKPSSAKTLPEQKIVKAVAVTAASLGPGVSRVIPAGGDAVAGEVTLDLCGADFPSESLRTARLQAIYSRAASAFGSEEVVTYRSGGAAKAAAEVRSAAALCPKHAVQSKVAGTPRLAYIYNRLPNRVPWPTGTLAYSWTATNGNKVAHLISIFMWARTCVLRGVRTRDG